MKIFTEKHEDGDLEKDSPKPKMKVKVTETDNFQYQERNMKSIRDREHRRSEYQQLIYREDVERLLR